MRRCGCENSLCVHCGGRSCSNDPSREFLVDYIGACCPACILELVRVGGAAHVRAMNVDEQILNELKRRLSDAAMAFDIFRAAAPGGMENEWDEARHAVSQAWATLHRAVSERESSQAVAK